MSDLISKSETIDLLYQVFEKYSMATDKNDPLCGFGAELFKNIKAMPTAYSVDKGDMKHNLAEMYAKNMVDYGVDVTKAWQTATQQSYALEKAYIRGRQAEYSHRYAVGYNEAADDTVKAIKELYAFTILEKEEIGEMARRLKLEVGDNT